MCVYSDRGTHCFYASALLPISTRPVYLFYFPSPAIVCRICLPLTSGLYPSSSTSPRPTNRPSVRPFRFVRLTPVPASLNATGHGQMDSLHRHDIDNARATHTDDKCLYNIIWVCVRVRDNSRMCVCVYLLAQGF